MEKLYSSVCSSVPPVCKPEAVGRGISIRAKVEQKVRMICLCRDKKQLKSSCSKQVHISLSVTLIDVQTFEGDNKTLVLRGREREMYLSLLIYPLPLKEEFTLFQKL